MEMRNKREGRTHACSRIFGEVFPASNTTAFEVDPLGEMAGLEVGEGFPELGADLELEMRGERSGDAGDDGVAMERLGERGMAVAGVVK